MKNKSKYRNRNYKPSDNSQKDKEKLPLKNRVSKMLEIPQSIFAEVGRIEITGNNEAILDECTAVLEYDETRIKAVVGKRTVLFRGEDLKMTSMNFKSIMIKGRIDSMEFMQQ